MTTGNRASRLRRPCNHRDSVPSQTGLHGTAPSSCPHLPEEVGRPPVTQSRAVTGCLSLGNRKSERVMDRGATGPYVAESGGDSRAHAPSRSSGACGSLRDWVPLTYVHPLCPFCHLRPQPLTQLHATHRVLGLDIFLFSSKRSKKMYLRKCLHPVFISESPFSCLPPSGVYFQGTTIGMAPMMSMCTAEQSGGIVMVSPPWPVPAKSLLSPDLVRSGSLGQCIRDFILPSSSLCL